MKVPAKHRFLSVEPLVKPHGLTVAHIKGVIEWVIVGGESNQKKHRGREFKVEWARECIDLAREAGAAPFVKQIGSYPTEGGKRLKLKDGHGGDWDEWPSDLRVREMPMLRKVRKAGFFV